MALRVRGAVYRAPRREVRMVPNSRAIEVAVLAGLRARIVAEVGRAEERGGTGTAHVLRELSAFMDELHRRMRAVALPAATAASVTAGHDRSRVVNSRAEIAAELGTDEGITDAAADLVEAVAVGWRAFRRWRAPGRNRAVG